jgi:hypothetical protein
MRGISRLAADLLASQEELCSMELAQDTDRSGVLVFGFHKMGEFLD